jgi:hypothetical protein
MTIDLEELRQQKAFEELQAQNQAEGKPVTTAFLVVQDTSGQWLALHDFDQHNLIPERAATLDDILGGSAAVMSGCTAQQAAFHTVMAMNQQAQQMRAAAENQKLMSVIDPAKLRNN